MDIESPYLNDNNDVVARDINIQIYKCGIFPGCYRCVQRDRHRSGIHGEEHPGGDGCALRHWLWHQHTRAGPAYGLGIRWRYRGRRHSKDHRP